jgi:hypothetical protein
MVRPLPCRYKAAAVCDDILGWLAGLLIC